MPKICRFDPPQLTPPPLRVTLTAPAQAVLGASHVDSTSPGSPESVWAAPVQAVLGACHVDSTSPGSPESVSR